MKRPLLNVIVATACALAAANAHAFLFAKGKEGMGKDCVKSNSTAWCVLDASQRRGKLGDMSAAQFKRSLASTGAGDMIDKGIDVAMIGATAMGAFTSAPGFTNITEAGMLIVNMLVNTNVPPLTGQNVVLAWMPYEMAADPEQARKKLNQIISEGVRKSFEGYDLEPATVATKHKTAQYGLNRTEHPAFVIRGGKCDDAECMLVQRRPIGEPSDYVWGELPTVGQAPEWKGGYKAWVFSRTDVAIPDLAVNGVFLTQTYAQELSRHLPDWAYVWITAQSLLGGNTINTGQAFPMFFNAGKPLLFVFPEIRIADPEAKESEKQKDEQPVTVSEAREQK